MRPGNDTSESNPFNTMSIDAYERWKAYNAQSQAEEQRRSREGVKAGNWTSNDNPMRLDPHRLNALKYGAEQPRFAPPQRRDAGRDREEMEARTRHMYEDVYGVNLNNHRVTEKI